MRINIVGNYRIGRDPWRLVEIEVSGVTGPLDFDQFQLVVSGQPSSNWQVPWNERILTEDKERAHLRACFFLYVEGDDPLQTPVGAIDLPLATGRPQRLAFVEFEEP